jgi:hypothetical protein
MAGMHPSRTTTMTTTTKPTEERTIRVHFLTRVDGVPSAEWPILRTEDMPYSTYLGMAATELANTRPKFLDEDGKEID